MTFYQILAELAKALLIFGAALWVIRKIELWAMRR